MNTYTAYRSVQKNLIPSLKDSHFCTFKILGNAVLVPKSSLISLSKLWNKFLTNLTRSARTDNQCVKAVRALDKQFLC